MEKQDMIHKLGEHDIRITQVEIEQKYNRKDIDRNNDALSKLVSTNNRIQIAVSIMVGSYLGWDKVVGYIMKFIGG